MPQLQRFEDHAHDEDEVLRRLVEGPPPARTREPLYEAGGARAVPPREARRAETESLEPLLAEEPPPREEPRQAPRPVRPRRSQHRTAVPGLYERLGTTLGLSFALALAGGMWYAGASFTLQLLASLGLHSTLAALAGYQWLIPLGISAAELFLWPRRGSHWRWMVFAPVLLLDVVATALGMVAWLTGEPLALARVPALLQAHPAPLVLGLCAGLAFAFVPEKLLRYALGELRALWWWPLRRHMSW